MKITKSEIAKVIVEYKALTQIKQNTTEKLGEIIGSTFSALTNLDPSYALEVLAQLNTFEKEVLKLVITHEEIKKANKEALMNVLPNTIED